MPLVDFLNTDGFSMVSLTQAINLLPTMPGRIGAMGLFDDRGITTTSALIEERQGVLNLLTSVPRGAPAIQAQSPKRTIRSFAVPHFPYEDVIKPEDIQNVRQFGSESDMEGITQVVSDRLTQMKQDHEVTLEYLRMGALHGLILDGDGTTVLFNLFTEFNVSEVTVDFELDNTDTDIRGKCHVVKRSMDDALGSGAFYSGITAFCGSDWFDDFTNHTNVKAAYERWNNGEYLRSDVRFGFVFAGITFEEYRGTVSGVDFQDSDQARFFPTGTAGMYLNINAPGDFIETANTIGLPMYAKQEITSMGRGVKLHTQANPLPLCTRPNALIKGT